MYVGKISCPVLAEKKMRLRPFVYHGVSSLPESLELLERFGSEVKVLAGGTDLVLAMKEKRVLPKYVLDLTGLSELDFVNQEDGVLRIGALTTHSSISGHGLIRGSAPALAEAAGLIGSLQIRNVASIGGNLCNASPAADSAPPLLAYGAQVTVVDTEGETGKPLESFFTGPGATSLKPGQLLKEIVIELPQGRSASCYHKLMRKKAVDLSLVGVAVMAELDEPGEKLVQAAVGLGGVAPTPIRAVQAEELLSGLSISEALERVEEAARMAMEAASPISDVRASADYKREMVEVFTRRGLKKILADLAGK